MTSFCINLRTKIILFFAALNTITTIFLTMTIFCTQYIYKGADTLSTKILEICFILPTMKLNIFLIHLEKKLNTATTLVLTGVYTLLEYQVLNKRNLILMKLSTAFMASMMSVYRLKGLSEIQFVL